MGIVGEVSVGELIDRITILELKSQRLSGKSREFVVRELGAARSAQERALIASSRLSELMRELRLVNRQLWDVEEELRECERTGSFGERFVALSRSVYKTFRRDCAS